MQIGSLCCFYLQYVSFYTGYMVTVLSLIVFVFLAWVLHTFMGRILKWFPEYESESKSYRNTIVKFTTLVIGIVYPGISWIDNDILHGQLL